MVSLIPVTWDVKATLIERPNRFLAIAQRKDGEGLAPLKIHVRDPGRLEELLFPGNELLIRHATNAARKTAWDLIAARFKKEWVLVNSGFHSVITETILTNPLICPFGPPIYLKREVKYGKSRLDFLISTQEDEKIYIEVKGCTLARNSVALFPDAPTKRGKRHLQELMAICQRGMRAAVIFLVFRSDSTVFMANRETDPEFANTLHEAFSIGVEIYPVLLEYRDNFIWYKSIIPITFF